MMERQAVETGIKKIVGHTKQIMDEFANMGGDSPMKEGIQAAMSCADITAFYMTGAMKAANMSQKEAEQMLNDVVALERSKKDFSKHRPSV